MPRLGELLVAAGAISAAQLEHALRAQVIHGARIGTNLRELGHVDLDAVALALARQHGVPAAQRRHFEACDPGVQARLPAEVAANLKVVPVGYLADGSGRVLVAGRDPLGPLAWQEVAAAMGLAADAVVPAIAPELRILYLLETVYGIPRATRFLRVRRPHPTAPIRRALDEVGDPAAWAEAADEAVDRLGDEPAPPRPGLPRAPAPPPPLPTTPFEPPPTFEVEQTPVEHLLDPEADPWRRPRRPVADQPPPPVEVAPAPAPASAARVEGADVRRFVETIDDAPPSAALGRIALRRMAAPPGSGDVAEAADLAQLFATDPTLADLARAIRRARTRTRIGELALGTLRHLGPGLEAGLLFVVRDEAAVGWMGFAAGVDDLAVDGLAVPLDAATVLGAAAREGRALVIDGVHGSPIDRRLWQAIGHPTPGQVAVAPILLSGTPVCLLYGQAPAMAPHVELFAAVTQATTAAFGRMLRAAQR
jgi:hypothetical protein